MRSISRTLFITIFAFLLGTAGHAETAGVLVDTASLSSASQSFSPYAENWQSVGKGQLIASGSHHFANKWVQGPNGRFWKNDEDPYRDPATHSEQEVAEDVLVHKGQVVIQGPGNIGYAYKFRGLGHAYMQEPGAPANIIPQGLGGLTMNKVNGEWSGEWVQATGWKRLEPGFGMSGWVPEGKTMTLDVYAQNRRLTWGHEAESEIHYEFWFFPKEGGKVLRTDSSAGDGNSAGTLFDQTADTEVPKGGTIQFGHRYTNTSNKTVWVDLYVGDTRVGIKPGTEILIKKKVSTSQKGGLELVFGRLFSLFKGGSKNGYAVETYNSVSGVEGTEFETAYDPSTGTSTVTVFEGTVNFSCKEGNVPALTVTQGLTASFGPNCAIAMSATEPAKGTPSKAGWELPSSNAGTGKVVSSGSSFYEDFSGGMQNFASDDPNARITDGKFFWATGRSGRTTFKWDIPMEDVVIEFDGYTENNGFGIHWLNEEELGYSATFGGWFNTKSGSHFGAEGQNVELVDGKVFTLKKWHHYKIVRSGSELSGYCDGDLVFSRTIPQRFNGPAELWFSSWAAIMGLDNIEVYASR